MRIRKHARKRPPLAGTPFRFLVLRLCLVYLVRQQRDVACSLDCERACSPVTHAVSGARKKGVPSRELPSGFSHCTFGLVHPVQQQSNAACSPDCERERSPVTRAVSSVQKKRSPSRELPSDFSYCACGLVHLVRQQSDVARSLDCERERSLVTRAVSGDAARKNLTSLGDVLLQRCNILIIDRLCALCTKHTNFSSSAHAARTSASLSFRSVTSVKRHDLVPLSL